MPSLPSPALTSPHLTSPHLYRCLTPDELNELLAGQSSICPSDWEAHACYKHCSPSTPQVAWFWSLLCGLAQPELASLLAFITGSSALPAGECWAGGAALAAARTRALRLLQENLKPVRSCLAVLLPLSSPAPLHASPCGYLNLVSGLPWCRRVCRAARLQRAQHPFTLSLVASEGDGRLPRASTCFNTLFLPCYSSPDVLRERLLAALSGQQAFDEGAAQRYTLQFSFVCLAEQSATPRLVVHRLQTRMHARSRKQHCQPSTA